MLSESGFRFALQISDPPSLPGSSVEGFNRSGYGIGLGGQKVFSTWGVLGKGLLT